VGSQDGSRALREAASLAPRNAQVEAAFAKLQLKDSIQDLLTQCQAFTQEKDIQAGKDALSYIDSRRAQISRDVAEECMQLLLGAKNTPDRDVKHGLVTSLLLYCPGARIYLAKQLQTSVTLSFQEVFDIGDGAANGLAATLLDATAWSQENPRVDCEIGVFQLFLAKLMESGHDHDGRAMKGIARLLAEDAERLHDSLDEDSFDAILAALDNRWPADVRGQATLATAKYLEVAKEKGEAYLTRFITTRVQRHANHDLGIAFSAAAAVFPLVPSVAASLFLTEGFLPSLISLLEKDTRSRKVEHAALAMLNAACIDSACREAISTHCSRWLHFIMRTSQDQGRGEAAVILAKVKSASVSSGASEKSNGTDADVAAVMAIFESMLLNGSESNMRNSVEGLAYLSTKPVVKESMIRNPELLRRLMNVAPGETVNKLLSRPLYSKHQPVQDTVAIAAAFGTLSIFDNLTRYLPQLSEEQKKIHQLKAYANASKASLEADPLDDDDHVNERCKAVIDAGIMSYLKHLDGATTIKSLSPTCLALEARILLSLARLSRHRGQLVQAGAVRLLKKIYNADSVQEPGKRICAHALARICISVNPSLISEIRDNISMSLSMILLLLDDDESDSSDSPRDLLPKFEALLALTNLASLQASEDFVEKLMTKVEDLLLSSNTMIQRAATELMCNLTSHPAGLMKLADGSPSADRRIHIFLALADAEDIKTRSAAGGLLAMATDHEAVVRAILSRPRGVKILLGLCQDEDEGCVYRGVFCVKNIISAEGETGKLAREAVKSLDGVMILKRTAGRLFENGDIALCCVEAWKLLADP
jgi:hypothetical protein